jgi:hypothetical protein
MKVKATDVYLVRRFIANDSAVGDSRPGRTFGYHTAHRIGRHAYMELGDKASGATKSDGAVMVRLDYNPNKLDAAELQGMFPFWRCAFVNITRLDIAIDYQLDLASSMVLHDTLLKTCRYGKRGQHQTVYMGSPQGERMFRVYDKRQERIDRGHEEDLLDPDLPWWRVEVQHRCSGNVLPDGLFDGLRVLTPDWAALNPTQYAIARTCMEEPDFLSRFSSSQRCRWRSMLDRLSTRLYPDRAYHECLTSLRAWAFGLVNLSPVEYHSEDGGAAASACAVAMVGA